MHMHAKGVILVSHNDQCDEMVATLREKGYLVDSLHRGREQQQRTEIIEAFREGSLRLLVATDAATRELDVDDVKVVINWDMAGGGGGGFDEKNEEAGISIVYLHTRRASQDFVSLAEGRLPAGIAWEPFGVMDRAFLLARSLCDTPPSTPISASISSLLTDLAVPPALHDTVRLFADLNTFTTLNLHASTAEERRTGSVYS